MLRWPIQALLAALLVSACAKDEPLVLEGTIQRLQVSGFACYLLHASDRKTYVLLNADELLARDGLHVAVEGRLRKGSTTPCQVGLPFAVSSYRVIRD